MPFAIHAEAAKKQGQWIVSRPQEQVPENLPRDFTGTVGMGLPVKQIPHYEFPRIVYMHPNEPVELVKHMNDKFEVVGEEAIPTEHLSKPIACAAHMETGSEKGKCQACKEELELALAEGWQLEPYINKHVATGDRRQTRSALYGPKKQKKA